MSTMILYCYFQPSPATIDVQVDVEMDTNLMKHYPPSSALIITDELSDEVIKLNLYTKKHVK